MIFSLQRRFLLLLLLPAALILIAVGVAGFLYARAFVMDQRIAAMQLKLEKAALDINRRLKNTTELINLITKANTIPKGNLTVTFLIQELLQKPGVRFVNIQTNLAKDNKGVDQLSLTDALDQVDGRGRYTMELCEDLAFCTPLMDKRAPDRALRIVKTMPGSDGKPAKRLVVRIAFSSFIKPIMDLRLWKGSQLALVTSTGEILAHTDESHVYGRRLGDTGNSLDKKILKEIYRKASGTVYGNGYPPDWVAGFYKVPSMNWYLILYSQGKEICAPLVRFRTYYVAGGLAVFVLILLLIRFTTRSVAQSVADISQAATKVQNGNYAVKLTEDRSDELGELKRTFNQMIVGLKQRDMIERTFGRYVDKNIADELMYSPEALSLGGQKRTVTIMMADIRNFTHIAENLEPEDVIKILNMYFAKMIEIIQKYRGIIVDFYGDSILVFFNGVEKDIAARASEAVQCALEMQDKQKDFAEEAKAEGLPEMQMGIGIHTGEVIVGNIGTETRAKYGIVGSNVNLTARIQTTASGGKTVISQETFNTVGSKVHVSADFSVCLKGVGGDRQLYEVEYMNGDSDDQTV